MSQAQGEDLKAGPDLPVIWQTAFQKTPECSGLAHDVSTGSPHVCRQLLLSKRGSPRPFFSQPWCLLTLAGLRLHHMQGPPLPVHEPTQTSPQQHVASVVTGAGFVASSVTGEPWGQEGGTKALWSSSLPSLPAPRPAHSLGHSSCLGRSRTASRQKGSLKTEPRVCEGVRQGRRGVRSPF